MISKTFLVDITINYLILQKVVSYDAFSTFVLSYLNQKKGNVTAMIIQKKSSRSVFKKRCSENMQQMYRRTPLSKCNFNKVAFQLYWNRTLAWVFSRKIAAYFQNTSEWLLLIIHFGTLNFVSSFSLSFPYLLLLK